MDNTQWRIWTACHGQRGLSSKSIFLPAVGTGRNSDLSGFGSNGFYWSSTPYSNLSEYASGLNFGSNYFGQENCERYLGRSVRPVRGFASPSFASGGVTTHIALDCSIIGPNQIVVTGVTAQQRYPWSGLVDVVVTMQGSAEDVAKAECPFVAMNSETKMAVPVKHVARNGDDAESGGVWTRKFIWDAKADVGTVKIDDLVLWVDAFVGVQLWEKGPYWAECNVGATNPEDCGHYFWWGGCGRVQTQCE